MYAVIGSTVERLLSSSIFFLLIQLIGMGKFCPPKHLPSMHYNGSVHISVFYCFSELLSAYSFRIIVPLANLGEGFIQYVQGKVYRNIVEKI